MTVSVSVCVCIKLHENDIFTRDKHTWNKSLFFFLHLIYTLNIGIHNYKFKVTSWFCNFLVSSTCVLYLKIYYVITWRDVWTNRNRKREYLAKHCKRKNRKKGKNKTIGVLDLNAIICNTGKWHSRIQMYTLTHYRTKDGLGQPTDAHILSNIII